MNTKNLLTQPGLIFALLLFAVCFVTSATNAQDKDKFNIEEHRDVTGSFIDKGFFDKSIQIPGTSISFLIGGYAKLDMIMDIDPIGNQNEFQTNTIPVEGTPASLLDGGFNMHVKETRLSLDFRSETPKGLFRAYIEFDLYNPDNTSLRLRHSYGVLGHLLAGHTWTTFMDISSLPVTVDFEHSEGSIFTRQAMIRWEQPISKNWSFGVAVEDPTPQIEIPEDFDGQTKAIIPDFVARTRYEHNGNHIQLAGIVRQLRYDRPKPEEDITEIGWGVNLTGRWKTFGKDDIRGGIAYGQGISRYIAGLGGTNSDAILTPEGDLVVIPSLNYMLGYLHYWTPDIRSGVTFAKTDPDNQQAQSDDDIGKLWAWHINTIWSPWHLVYLGVEFIYGQRVNKDGSKGTANRVQVAFRFNFN